MATTLFTTWTRITGETLEEATNLDPHADLGLTDVGREGLQQKALAHLTAEVERILEPFQAQFLGNGDIIGPAELAGDFQSALDNEYGIREELGMIDLNEVLTPFFN